MYLLINTGNINRIVAFLRAIRQPIVSSPSSVAETTAHVGRKAFSIVLKGLCTIYQADCSVISVEGPWRALTMRLKVGTNLLQHKCIEQERESF